MTDLIDRAAVLAIFDKLDDGSRAAEQARQAVAALPAQGVMVKRYDLEQPDSHMGSARMAEYEYGDWVRYEDAIAALPAQGVRVKPLVWEPSAINKPWHSARCPWGWYFVQWDAETQAWFASLEMGEVEHPIILQPQDVPTIDAAKAAAQADYERRVIAALEPAEAGGVEHWRGKYRWLMWRIMWAQEKCLSHDLPDDIFSFLEADSADLRDNSFTCECGALVHHEDAFMCDDGPTLCFRCKPDTAAIEPRKEVMPDEAHEDRPATSPGVTAGAVEALVKAAGNLKEIVEGIKGAMEHGTWRDEKGKRFKDAPEWVAFYNALAAIREGRG